MLLFDGGKLSDFSMGEINHQIATDNILITKYIGK